MKIKPKYTDPETTPLKFVKFIRITLWIGLFLNLSNIISAVSPAMDWYGLIAYGLIEVLDLAAISGLNRMDWYGVKAYWGIYLVQLGDGLLTLGVYGYYGRMEVVARALGQITSSVIFLVLTWIYFQKRRLLFTPIPEEYLPLMEKEKEALQALMQEKKVEPRQSSEEGQVPSQSESISVPLTESQGSAAVSEQQPMEEGEERPESRFCWNCGNPLIRDSNFCNMCGKAVYRPVTAPVQPQKAASAVVLSKLESKEEKNVSSTILEKPTQKSRKGWIGLVLALLTVALAAGIVLLREDFVQAMTPTQAAENVLYLEVYNDADECIGTGSGFLVKDRTTLVTNYHVMENASYLLVVNQNHEVAAVADTALAYDVDMDLAVLRCDREVEVQPLILGNSGTVKQGEKIYAAGYPLGIANTLSDGIVSSKYVDGLGVEVLQITAPISGGSSGGAVLNENGQVVGVVCASYTDGQNMNLAISVNQLQSLLEQKEESTQAVLLKTVAEGDGKHFRKSRNGFVYCKIPSVLSLENVFEESDEIYFVKTLPLQEGYMYSYMTASKKAYRYYIKKYADLLVENGYTVNDIYNDSFSAYTPDGVYWIYVYDGYGSDDGSNYPILVRFMKAK